jgi:hypothetical protein
MFITQYQTKYGAYMNFFVQIPADLSLDDGLLSSEQTKLTRITPLAEI